MGPSCEVLIEAVEDSVLDRLDELLAKRADVIERTRKGRVWKLWIAGRPLDVRLDESPPAVILAAGCNGPEDQAVLRSLAAEIAARFQGLASEPSK